MLLFSLQNYRIVASLGLDKLSLVAFGVVVDRGAGLNLVRRNALSHDWLSQVITSKEEEQVRLREDNKARLRTSGTVTLWLQTGARIVPVPFLVVDDLSVPDILGCTFIGDNTHAILPQDRSIRWTDGSVTTILRGTIGRWQPLDWRLLRSPFDAQNAAPAVGGLGRLGADHVGGPGPGVWRLAPVHNTWCHYRHRRTRYCAGAIPSGHRDQFRRARGRPPEEGQRRLHRAAHDRRRAGAPRGIPRDDSHPCFYDAHGRRGRGGGSVGHPVRPHTGAEPGHDYTDGQGARDPCATPGPGKRGRPAGRKDTRTPTSSGGRGLTGCRPGAVRPNPPHAGPAQGSVDGPV